MLSQINASQNSRQTILNNHNDFKSFTCIMTERFNNIQKFNLTIIPGKRVRKRAKKRKPKIKQTNYWLVFKETIKVEDKQKGYNRVETKHLFKDSVKDITQDSQINISFCKYVKNIKIYNN